MRNSTLQRADAQSPQELLESQGYALIDSTLIPLTQREWDHLDELTSFDNLSYEFVGHGDTDESVSVQCSRLKKPSEDFINKEIEQLFTSSKMFAFYEHITHTSSLCVDRCQSHVYSEGDFLALHTDTESTPRYLYTLLIGMSDGYEGGALIVHDEKNGRKVPFMIPKNSILILKSTYPHEVTKIKSGQRKVIASFLQKAVAA